MSKYSVKYIISLRSSFITQTKIHVGEDVKIKVEKL